MNDNQFMDCEHDANANRLQVGIAAHADKVTEEGAPDQTVVAFPNRVPNGTYQLVAISNPYGAIREAGTTYGSVSCVALQVTGDEGLGEWKVYGTGQPANCQLPTTIPGALTGPGGTDPFAGANPVAACNPLLTTTGHCWDTIPVDGAHPLAHTNVHDNSTGDRHAHRRPVRRGGHLRRRRWEPRRRRRWHDHAAEHRQPLPPKTRA